MCTPVMSFLIWRRGMAMLAPMLVQVEGEDPPGPDPMDLPGDGLSPFDLFLVSLPPAPVDDAVEAVAA
ncbi:MAG TPA: hypothetical protein VHT75_06575 [Acidimicrobiales bacterium]|nr:hypothetical protein [Acidimicrobiales bacterium]